ncbi:putative protein disulfide isomerase [Trypanosoma grayi]|uniref:putative protein disulfide isomerase n=1 Tax=Trypanosoma grayi TaxID=71804 RepID=UPI0004F428D4|nr:putative protein disulfide isomerase [Trypanosoma grayi]KEG08580.1 putative protein disulfide isomerase [Trypanosoma grayi]
MRRCSSIRAAIFLAVVLVAAAFPSVALAEDPSEPLEGVADLNAATFDAQVGKDIPALVEFYAPWCGHCKNLVPEMQKLGLAAKAASGKVLVGKVDATQHGDLAGRFGVSGYPTILFFPAGSVKPERYSGQRDASAFVSFLNERSQGLRLSLPREHKYVTQLDKDNYDAIALDDTKDTFIMFYAPWCGHCKKLHPIFERLAMVYKDEPDVVIASLNADDSANAAVRSRYEIDGFPTLVFLSKGMKDKPIYYNKDRELDAFVKFLNAHTGKNRLETGDLSAEAGVDVGLTKLLQDMLVEGKSAEEKQQLLAQVKDAAVLVAGEAAVQYPRIAARVLDGGVAYIDKELARIGRMKQGDLRGTKRDMMTIRANILTSIKPQ